MNTHNEEEVMDKEKSDAELLREYELADRHLSFACEKAFSPDRPEFMAALDRMTAAEVALTGRKKEYADGTRPDPVAALEQEHKRILRQVIEAWTIRCDAHRGATEAAEARVAALEAEVARLKAAMQEIRSKYHGDDAYNIASDALGLAR